MSHSIHSSTKLIKRGRAFTPARIALTIAWRTAARSVKRSLLISILIALPIAGLSAVSIVGLSIDPTPAEKIATTLGHTEARITIVSTPDPGLSQVAALPEQWRNGDNTRTEFERETITALVPAGTEVVPVFSSIAAMQTATGLATMQVTEGQPWHSSLRGHYNLVSGTTPNAADEVMVNPSALKRLGVAVGGTIHMRSPLSETFTVVGVLDDRARPSATNIIFGQTGSLTEELADGVSADQRTQQTAYYLPNTVVTWAGVEKLNARGAIVLSRSVLLDPPPATSGLPAPRSTLNQLLLASALLGGFTIFEVVLLAGAAFAVTMRAEQRTLAIVASVGGTRRTLFTIVSSSGIVLGAIGGIIGVLLGLGGAVLFMQFTGDGSDTRYYGLHVNLAILAAIIVFSALVGWIAALAPAVGASRIDVVGALRGARRPPKPNRRRPLIGVVVMAIGFIVTLLAGGGLVYFAQQHRTVTYDGGVPVLILTVLVMAGPILVQVGIALCGPLVLRVVARLFNSGKLGSRLATRDASRNPARSVPAFITILTTVFVAVFAMCIAGSGQARSDEDYSFATMKGQVSSNLWLPSAKDMGVVRVEGPAYVSALTDNLDLKSIRVLKALPDMDVVVAWAAADGRPLDDSIKPADTYPVLTIPPTNLCSLSAMSPDFKPVTSSIEASQVMAADPRCPNSSFTNSQSNDTAHLWVGDAADLAQILGRQPSAAALKSLADGNAVALYRDYVLDGHIEINWWKASVLAPGLTAESGLPESVTRIPAVVDEPQHPIKFGVFIPTATADKLTIGYLPALILATPATPPTSAPLDAARAATANLTADPEGASLTIEDGSSSQTAWISWALFAVSALIAIGASAVAIGLARFDGRRDDAVLDSLGAGRLTRRSFAFWQSLVLASLGAVLGSILALLPALALQLPGSGMPFAPPWIPILTTAVALPLVIAVGSWLFSHRKNIDHAVRTT